MLFVLEFTIQIRYANLRWFCLLGPDCERVFDGCAAEPCSLDRKCSTLTAEEQKILQRGYNCSGCQDGYILDAASDRCLGKK